MKEESMHNMIEGLEEALGIGQHFEPDVIEAFEKSLEEMEKIVPECKGAKETYTNALIEIMKVPQKAQGLIITCLIHKCLHINEVPILLKQEQEFMSSYLEQRLVGTDNPITRLITAALKAKKNSNE